LTVAQTYPYRGYWLVALAEHSCPGVRHFTAPLIVARVCPDEQIFPDPPAVPAVPTPPAALVTALGAAGVTAVWAFGPQPVRVTAAARVTVRIDVRRFTTGTSQVGAQGGDGTAVSLTPAAVGTLSDTPPRRP